MRVNRFFAVAAALFIAVLPARAEQILAAPRIDNSSRVVLPGGPTLGLWQNGKFTSTPDAISANGPIAGTSGTFSGPVSGSTLAGTLTPSTFASGVTQLPSCTPGSSVAPVPTGQPFQCGGAILIAQ